VPSLPSSSPGQCVALPCPVAVLPGRHGHAQRRGWTWDVLCGRADGSLALLWGMLRAGRMAEPRLAAGHRRAAPRQQARLLWQTPSRAFCSWGCDTLKPLIHLFWCHQPGDGRRTRLAPRWLPRQQGSGEGC